MAVLPHVERVMSNAAHSPQFFFKFVLCVFPLPQSPPPPLLIKLAHFEWAQVRYLFGPRMMHSQWKLPARLYMCGLIRFLLRLCHAHLRTARRVTVSLVILSHQRLRVSAVSLYRPKWFEKGKNFRLFHFVLWEQKNKNQNKNQIKQGLWWKFQQVAINHHTSTMHSNISAVSLWKRYDW